MIILHTHTGKPVGLRPSHIIAVEEHPEDPSISAVTHTLNHRAKKTNIILVKHTVQEVVDALNKVDSFY